MRGESAEPSPETSLARRLDPLAREEAVDRGPVDAEDAAHADGVQAPVMDQAPDRLRVDAELPGDLAERCTGPVVADPRRGHC